MENNKIVSDENFERRPWYEYDDEEFEEYEYSSRFSTNRTKAVDRARVKRLEDKARKRDEFE